MDECSANAQKLSLNIKYIKQRRSGEPVLSRIMVMISATAAPVEKIELKISTRQDDLKTTTSQMLDSRAPQ